MKKAKLLDSPVVLLVFLGATLLFSWAWWKSESRDNAPTIPGYSWEDHPDVALISDQTSCCGIPNHDWVETALKNKADVLILSVTADPELKHLLEKSRHPRYKLVVTDDENLVKFFSPNGNTGGARIVKGRVIAKVEGGVPPSFLYQPLR